MWMTITDEELLGNKACCWNTVAWRIRFFLCVSFVISDRGVSLYYAIAFGLHAV
jgi:hypothetical protein